MKFVDNFNPNPCTNNVNCMEDGNEHNDGDICDTDIDDCDPNPCMNNGTCADGVNSFTCNCVDSFTGQTCQNGMF